MFRLPQIQLSFVGRRMLAHYVPRLILVIAQILTPQVSAKVDFRRDIQPIFREYCLGCHGPSQQMGGLRLDRRRDAMRGGTVADIGPGNSAASRLYLRLIGNQYGPQMPLTGALNSEQINFIKAWIDQGAEWPDDVSGETATRYRCFRSLLQAHRRIADQTSCEMRGNR